MPTFMIGELRQFNIQHFVQLFYAFFDFSKNKKNIDRVAIAQRIYTEVQLLIKSA